LENPSTYDSNRNKFIGLNTFRRHDYKHHKIIEISVTGGSVIEILDFKKHYQNFEWDYKNEEVNYEGIDIDEQGNIHVLNDAMKGNQTHLLTIRKKGEW
jgi:hypothetical protein